VECVFPANFLWGTATAAHQIEGNNVNADYWAVEHEAASAMAEPSGDACDSLHRWREDLDIVQQLGLNSYRFSIEWARIEPEPGFISQAMLRHYRAIIDGCLERGLTPIVTLHHFTSPRWLTDAGGWADPQTPTRFANYVRAVLPILDGVEWVCTINEPNMYASATAFRRHGLTAEGVLTSPRGFEGALTPELMADFDSVTARMLDAHDAARDILHSRTDAKIGWTVGHLVLESVPGSEEMAAAWSDRLVDQFLLGGKGDDFIGVQAYSRFIIGGPSLLGNPDIRRTQMGYEFHPQALGKAVRLAAALLPGQQIVVTENGIATADDAERIEHTEAALRGLHAAITDGIDVGGYFYWSLLDNYEWGSYRPTFGLVAVDRATFVRTVKPSAVWYGEVAQNGALTR
jgi:beta-glucosidase